MLEKVAGHPPTLFEKIVSVLLIIIFLFTFYIALDANKYRAEVNVIAGEGKIGVNPTQESLDFGDMSPGTTAVRRVDISNQTPVPVYLMIFNLGSISDLMKLDRNFFTLYGGEKKKLEFLVYMPASAKVDSTLSGRVYILKIPKLWQWGAKAPVASTQ